MFLKFLHLHIKTDEREAFIKGQRKWSALRGLPGFQGQWGGITETDDALIFGLWQDRAAYDGFMSLTHDDIAARAKQSGTYDRLDVGLFDWVMDMPGQQPDTASSLPKATHLRWADCTVLPDRIDAFVEKQEALWKPTMATSGMLGGAFWRSTQDPRRFLVLTLWPNSRIHNFYSKYALSSHRKKADTQADIETINGGFIELNRKWKVSP